mmetsp:Transcript_41392/g.103321  ORF Transcript_41392/g.103321 Transcript_41392/m.103321 type:complete len:269 (-) Transcript_41392:189-995(-)
MTPSPLPIHIAGQLVKGRWPTGDSRQPQWHTSAVSSEEHPLSGSGAVVILMPALIAVVENERMDAVKPSPLLSHAEHRILDAAEDCCIIRLDSEGQVEGREPRDGADHCHTGAGIPHRRTEVTAERLVLISRIMAEVAPCSSSCVDQGAIDRSAVHEHGNAALFTKCFPNRLCVRQRVTESAVAQRVDRDVVNQAHTRMSGLVTLQAEMLPQIAGRLQDAPQQLRRVPLVFVRISCSWLSHERCCEKEAAPVVDGVFEVKEQGGPMRS